MEHNLESLRQRVIIDKLDDEEFDPGIVDRFINDTQRNIFNQFTLPFQEKIFEGDIPQGSAMIKLPDDAQIPQSLVLTSPEYEQKELSHLYIPFREFNKLFLAPTAAAPDTIKAWTLYGNSIIFNAPTIENFKLTMFYLKKPTTLLNGLDVPEIPSEFSELLVLGAFKRIQERNEDYDQAAVTGQQFNDNLDMMVSRYGFRKADTPVKMKNSKVRQ